MKIALISVAPPFRGGISKHTSILAEYLSVNHSIDIINYSRQYPGILFPGKSQYLDDYLDIDNNYKYIDSINPFSWFKTARFINQNNYDLVIFRFWNPFFSPALSIIASIIKKKSVSSKLISLCDNIIPHERFPLSDYFIKMLFNNLDGHLVQSNQTAIELKQVVDSPKYIKSFHPLYNTFQKKLDKEVAKSVLNLKTNNVILYFGIIRDYKGLDILINSINILKDKYTDFHLIIAGECYGDSKQYEDLMLNFNLSKYITWHNYYISDKKVHNYFSAADVVVLPYRSASQSGVAQIAYNYNIPIIVSDIVGLAEIVENGKSGFIFESENPIKLANILYENFQNSTFTDMQEFISTYKKIFSWEKFVESIEILYHKL